MDSIFEKLEPLVIHVRSGANCEELRDEIVKSLSKDHGFINCFYIITVFCVDN